MDIVPFLVLVVFLRKPGIHAYDDLRNKNCRSRRALLPHTKANEVVWSGDIKLKLQCDPGYDYPLNFNSEINSYIIICEGNNRWSVDFVPDCNPLFVPVVTLSFQVKKVEECTKKKSSLHTICKKGAYTCSVLKTSYLNCQPNKHSMELRINIRNTTWARDNDISPLLADVLKFFADSPQVTEDGLKSRFECPNGTLKRDASQKLRCRGCPIGHFLDVSGQACLPCQKGYYQDKTMQTSCNKCPHLIKVDEGSELWGEIEEKSQNRTFHVLGCPRLIRDEDGNIRAVTAEQDFEREMDLVIQNRINAMHKPVPIRNACLARDYRSHKDNIYVVVCSFLALQTLFHL